MSEAKQSTDLVVMRVLTPAAVFGAAAGGLESILEKIEAEVRSIKTDISTPAGRAAISSLAYKVARSKTALDEMGKELISELKAKTGAVDAERRVIRERLDALKEEVRKPLTQWEEADQVRVKDHEKAILDLELLLDFGGQEPTAAQLQERINILATRPAREWQEFVQRASEVALRVGKRLEDAHAVAVRREAEREELARLRREQIEREQRERDERIAAEAAERARLEAEAQARQACAAAEERAARAEQERIKAEQERNAAVLKAEQNRVEQAAQAERDKQAAIEAERERVAALARKEAVAAEAREANRKHRARINNEVLVALVAAGLTEDLGKNVIAAIFGGSVPHVRITY